MRRLISLFVLDQTGATAIEYALIGALVGVAIIAALTTLGSQLQTTFAEVSNNLK